jgi:hypothetical protein
VIFVTEIGIQSEMIQFGIATRNFERLLWKASTEMHPCGYTKETNPNSKRRI